MKKHEVKIKGEISVEKLNHFRCGVCCKWWSIGDAPKRKEWHCPWCGTKQNFKIYRKK